ncbi:MAG: HEAT repeat domain-containing protein [Planctomycetes bacterium]|nr:HEAT repeat domain-containing protein [Planctomycetota bacterium]
MALWCKELELDTEYHDELERTIQLDANHEAARVALGFKKNKKGKWVRPKSSRAPTPEELAAKRRQEDEEKLVRKLVTEWFIKIKAIHKGRLGGDGSSASGDKLANGREQILAIHDPLAIPAISGVLSTGNVKARSVMVESLSQFKEDEATMNLLVASLLDPDEGVRKLAAQALFPRHDKRVESRLIDALYSDEELIIRHAAVVLGTLKSNPAIEHLINVLSKETRQKVVVNRHVILGGVRSDFGGINRYVDGNRVIRYQPTTINCLGRGTMIGTFSSLEMQTVMIHRTEVQEALIAITGQNHGFDQEAWSNWLIQQPKP